MTEATLDRPRTGEMSMLNEKGDTKIMWDRTNHEEVEIARAAFDAARAKGHAAFRAVGKEGTKGSRLDTFDPDAERIIMVPRIVGG